MVVKKIWDYLYTGGLDGETIAVMRDDNVLRKCLILANELPISRHAVVVPRCLFGTVLREKSRHIRHCIRLGLLYALASSTQMKSTSANTTTATATITTSTNNNTCKANPRQAGATFPTQGRGPRKTDRPKALLVTAPSTRERTR